MSAGRCLFFLVAEFEEEFFADVFVDEAQILLDEFCLNFLQRWFYSVTLKFSFVWVDEGEPESDEGIFDDVESASAFFRVFFGCRDALFYKTEINERGKVWAEDVCLKLQYSCNLAEFVVSKSYCFHDGEVADGFFDLFFQKVDRFFVEESVGVEYVFPDVFKCSVIIVEEFKVLWNPASEGVEFDEFCEGFGCVMSGKFGEPEWFEEYLCGSSSIQGT